MAVMVRSCPNVKALERCSDVKVRLSQDKLHAFELFINGRHDTALTDSDSSDQENYTCHCGKIFKKKTAYQRHIDISHSNTVSYHCNVCGKTFGKKCTLTMHMSIHGTTDRKAFDSMERPSTRSQVKSIANLSSPLREKKTDSVVKQINFDTNDIKRITRSLSKDSINNVTKTDKYSTRSTSRERTLHQSPCKTRVSSRSTSRSVERKETATKVQEKVTPEKNVSKQLKINSDNSYMCSEENSDNNNIKVYLPSEKSDTVVNENNNEISGHKKQLIIATADNVTASYSSSVSHESDKENSESQQVVKNREKETELAVSSITSSDIPTSKIVSEIKPREKIQVIKLPSELKEENLLVHTNNNNNILVEKPASIKGLLSPDRNRVSIINNITKKDSEVKPNTQTIVIVIREAKRLQNDTTTGLINTATTKAKDMIATQQIVPVNSNSFQQQKMVIENNNLVAKPITGHQVRPVVSRTVVSVAPSVVTNSHPSMLALRTNPIQREEQVVATDSELSPFSGDGETTESDDGIDEYTPVRKSARLDGKVPGWKKILNKDSGIAQLVDEPRQRKRKVGRPRIDDHELPEDGELSDVAEELFGAMAAEMDIDDKEIQDMSSSLFARRPRMYKDEYSCDICGKSFSTEKYLQMHSSLHGASTPARNLVAENYKVNELKDVDGYRSTWTCKICNKSFAQNSSFKNHMRTHSDERPFVCDVCCIGFKERYHLKKHMLFKHSDELKEKCQFCGKRFKDSTAVRAHERIHSDHRPYPCRRCGKAFKTSECLWHHENRSKTCGAMGGPPLPPLPKKGRISRKNKQLQEQAVIQSVTLKKEENNMLDLVQQIIHADTSTSQQQTIVSTSSPHVNIPVQTVTAKTQYQPVHQLQQQSHINTGMMSAHTSANSYPQTVSHPITTPLMSHQQTFIQHSNSTTALPTVTSIPTTVKAPTAQTTQQMHTVKLNQGQSLVFSVPVLKDGNIDPAAQVTKAILDAISNTTGNLKGNINIQKTIQCAVNNVQEAFDPAKNNPVSSSNINGQSRNTVLYSKPNENSYKVAQAVNVSNRQRVVVTESLPLPHQQQVVQQTAVQQQQQHHHHQLQHSSLEPTYVMGQEIKQEPGVMEQYSTGHQQSVNEFQRIPAAAVSQQQMLSQDKQQQQVVMMPHTSVSPTTTKPYLVSILPPLASVAQAMKPQIKTELEAVEDDYSTDSGDEDEDCIAPMAPVIAESNKVMTSSGINSRPIATVQPVRRVEYDVNKQISTELGVIESTSEPYIVNPTRMKQSNYTCPKCHKGFASISAYQKHLLKHEEVRPFRCDTCDIGFKLKVHLKKHNLYRHSTDYPCECSICGKRFKDSSAVRLHERIHSEDRPFQCGCGKSFKTKENLWGHQNRKMCPYAGYPPPHSSCDTSQYYNQETSPIHAHAKLEDGGVTAHASVKSLSNKIIAEAVVSNKHVKAQAVIGQNGEVTAHASVYPKFEQQYPQPDTLYTTFNSENVQNTTDHKAILKTENGEIHCTVSLPSSTHSTNSAQSQLPSFATFASSVRSPSDESINLVNNDIIQIKKESIADQCPTIQNLLKLGPRSVTKLPGIQQLFKQHIKPPPPYPGHMTPPRCYSDNSSYSSQCSGSPVSSPTQGIPSSPISSYSRQNSQSPITSNLNVMLNPDQLYATGTTRDPFLRTPPLYSKCESNPSDYSPSASILTKSPRVSHAVSPSPSVGADGNAPPIIYWDDEAERKPVVAQWQQTDSETLFHELSNSMINQL